MLITFLLDNRSLFLNFKMIFLARQSILYMIKPKFVYKKKLNKKRDAVLINVHGFVLGMLVKERRNSVGFSYKFF